MGWDLTCGRGGESLFFNISLDFNTTKKTLSKFLRKIFFENPSK
jgi:hypothetical protein